MGKRVYHYNTPKAWVAVLFHLAWAMAWVGVFAFGGGVAHLYHGDDPVVAGFLMVVNYVVALLGVVVAITFCWSSAKLQPERISIEGETLTFVDRHGQQITCPLSGVISLTLTDSDLLDGSRRTAYNNPQMYKVLTTSGAFRFYPWISGCADLREVLDKGAAEHAAIYPNAVTEGTDIDLCPKR